jgi:hypothetical protein
MRVTIDLDGTWLAHPEVFGPLARALEQAGHTVGILTGHRPEQAAADHAWFVAHQQPWPAWRIYCDYQWTPTELAIVQQQGTVQAVGAWKARMLATHQVDLHIDDMAHTIRPYLTSATVVLALPPLGTP